MGRDRDAAAPLNYQPEMKSTSSKFMSRERLITLGERYLQQKLVPSIGLLSQKSFAGILEKTLDVF